VKEAVEEFGRLEEEAAASGGRGDVMDTGYGDVEVADEGPGLVILGGRR
jgi:hypothetical protein